MLTPTSCLLLLRPHDFSADGFNDWAFMTTHSWDEDPSGEWVLEIENTSDAKNYGRSVLPHPLPPSKSGMRAVWSHSFPALLLSCEGPVTPWMFWVIWLGRGWTWACGMVLQPL